MMNRPIKIGFKLFILLLVFLILISPFCVAANLPQDQWKTATPESQGMSSEVLSDMMDVLWQTNHEIDSILIIRNGNVVLDTYNFPEQPDLKHRLYSCTKSVSSALIGIAIDKGYIKSVNQPISDFFPEKIPENIDSRKQMITLKHLLTMATGLKCQDSYLYEWKGLYEMFKSEDLVQHVINLPMSEDPGTRFEYCNGASSMLTAIIQKTTGITALEFAKDHLFKPMGITDFHWTANWGVTNGYLGLSLRPHDMAKFGYLYLNNGKWGNQQLISENWVKESTQKHITATYSRGYGYQWWILGSDTYAAIGYGGQRIFVSKDKQMVVVFTSRLKDQKAFLPEGILKGYILQAVKSNSSLPENSKAFKRLKSLDHFWETSNYVTRDQKFKKINQTVSKLSRELYVNDQLGFSVEYDPELIVSEQELEAPFVFSKAGLTGLPVISVFIDNIPQGVKLDETEKYLVKNMERMPEIRDIKVNEKKMIKLSDGAKANYFEMKMKYQTIQMVMVGVISYKNKKLICVNATDEKGVQIEELKSMVKSLRLKKPKP